MNALENKTVLVGVTGGIAAYKVCGLVSRLVKSGATVHVMMTRNATQFVAPLSFETLSRNRVTVDTFDRDFTWEVEHVSLAKKADVAIVAPATANVIAKLACGIADDFLTTTLLACRCKVLFAPAMNTAMFDNVATRENMEKLVSRGFIPVYGENGYLACGDTGAGRMAEPEVLYAAIENALSGKTDYVGKRVLVTSGATRTEIDPVRFISNRSSGKMGYAIANEVSARGGEVVYIKGFTDKFDIPSNWTTESVKTTAEMFEAVKKHAPSCDVCIMAAAPCDYEVAASPQKIKSKTLTVNFTKAVDIAAWVGENTDCKLVVFAAETQDGERNAVKKLQSKHADMAVLNDVTAPGAGFDVDTNIATIVTSKGSENLPLMSKRELAGIILDKTTLL
ncbi:MAG: bifunctional phosphopantothenoylcysteine decarboxylase/phosphopantothenate--cysteine ligase CoaBC [Clostridia bacterium]|nr:bifunctional phosphopantothenoylcysteine decarboxylase/phosphopantothenate--cysteine ligase CoaBC [Clostridia bacterium]